jgi:D-alanine-D-alanine ligase
MTDAQKKRVLILFGGKSGEHEVSCVSALSVYRALDKTRYEATLLGIDKTGRWILPNRAMLIANNDDPRLINLGTAKEAVTLLPYESDHPILSMGDTASKIESFDVVLPILHGTNGEDGTIQGLLELSNLPYVGSGVLGSALCMDKALAKVVMQGAGIPVVPYLIGRRHDFKAAPNELFDAAEAKFKYPYFVKPSNTGSSMGVHKVKSRAEALDKIADSFTYDSKVLFERSVDARELEVSVLGNNVVEVSCVGEIVPRHEFYSYEAKYLDTDGAELHIPAKNLSPEMEKTIREFAARAFIALDCAGLARVDFFVDRKTNELFLNELNTIPGFTKISMYPKLWEASGLPYAKLLDRLIDLALERHADRASNKTDFEGEV